MTCDC